jgi:hypothetical protein
VKYTKEYWEYRECKYDHNDYDNDDDDMAFCSGESSKVNKEITVVSY